MRPRIFILFYLIFISFLASAQNPVEINSSLNQHVFSFQEIEELEDQGGNLTLGEVRTTKYSKLFTPSKKKPPQNYNIKSVYWYRIKINQGDKVQNRFLLEFFDQSIDDLTAYIPRENGKYSVIKLGDKYKFDHRIFQHKNFEIELDKNIGYNNVFYFRIKSAQKVNVIIVLRSVNWFIQYALNEYFSFGIFYGMILVFSFYNLIMFLYIRQKQYLYYVIYNLSVGLYQISMDGIAYQYLWPNNPSWNQIAYAVAICCMSVFALLFTQKLLQVKAKAPFLNKLINLLILLRIAVFFCLYFFDQVLYRYVFIEAIPLALAFFTGIYIYKRGYKPARYFVLGYGFLFLGYTLKLMTVLGVSWLNVDMFTYHSLSICFVFEMIFLSLAIGDKVRFFKKKKEKAQEEIIKQMRINEKMKDFINKKLEIEVQERTKEVFEKSAIIEQQNLQLNTTNKLLERQAEEISKMNRLLEQDNKVLKVDIEKVTRARIMSTDVDFTEFSKIYPDKESCFKFLAELKWGKGYSCQKCNHIHYSQGHTLYSRRCTKCDYEESVMMNTLFQNSRIPITKSFYMIFLIYTTKGKISSHKLSNILEIRQSTCWVCSSKIKKIMEERKKELKNAGDMGWSKLVLE